LIRIPVVLNLLAVLLMIFAAAMLLPLGISLVLGDHAELVHAEALYFTGLTGGLLWILTRRAKSELQTRDGFVFVVLVWTVLPAFATLPLLGYVHGLGFTDAYFEAMSGLTATGATVLSSLDALPTSLHIWRALLQWFGGMGVIVLAVAVLPLLGIGGRQILRAETPGPMKEKQLTPRIAQTAKGLWYVYVLLTVLCMAGYYAAGMQPVDAFIHAFSTVSLGGFSSHDASFAYFQSPAVESVAIFFMLAAAINFGTHFIALRRLTLRPYLGDPELRACLMVIAASVLLVSGFLFLHGVGRDHHRLRDGRLQRLATVRAAVHGLAVRLLHQLAVGRRRHQDDAGAGAVPDGVSRARPHGASAGADAGEARRAGGGEPHHLRGAGLHAGLRRDADRDHHAAGRDRGRFPHRFLRRVRLRQQPGPGAGLRRSRRELCAVQRFPDLDLHSGDAAWPPGADHGVRGAYAGVLAEMTASAKASQPRMKARPPTGVTMPRVLGAPSASA
jgi:hypothetical protein